MSLVRKFLFPALTVALALGAAEPVVAQAVPLGGGGGLVQQGPSTRAYAFDCVELPNGQITGCLYSANLATQSFLQVDITSAMHIGSWLAVAGEIRMAVNTPPTIGVGQTFAATFIDNGLGGAVPDQLATVVVPPQFGNLTIQQLIALIGAPPLASFSPFVSGGIWVH